MRDILQFGLMTSINDISNSFSFEHFVHLLLQFSILDLLVPSVLVCLLLYSILVALSLLFNCVLLRAGSQIIDVLFSIFHQRCLIDDIFSGYLIVKVVVEVLLLHNESKCLIIKLLISGLGTEMRLVVFLVYLPHQLLPLLVVLNLLGEVGEILQVVSLPQLGIVQSNHILLFLLPVELMSLLLS